MESVFFTYVAEYGYFALFAFVFLQEIGVPTPVPNEFMLLFAGFLTFQGVLDFPFTVATVIAAEFLGTSTFYAIFHFFGHWLLGKRWFPVSKERIGRIGKFLSNKGWLAIFGGRLVPYVRGYTSMAAGFVQVSPYVFLPISFVTAIAWSGGYVFLGKFLGPKWDRVVERFGSVHAFVIATLVVVVLVFMFPYVHAWHKRRKGRRVMGNG